jgi:hypothetical protein
MNNPMAAENSGKLEIFCGKSSILDAPRRGTYTVVGGGDPWSPSEITPG